jgi:hypothetical protein
VGLTRSQRYVWAQERLGTATRPEQVRAAMRALHGIGLEPGRAFQARIRRRLRELGAADPAP